MLLIYIIAFSIISFCDSRKTETYTTLVLTQRFAITKFFYEQLYRKSVNTQSNAILEYLKAHRMLFLGNNWVIHGLWALDEHNNLMTNCVSSKGAELALNYEALEQNLQDDLKLEWPLLSIHGTDRGNMQIEYRELGSCVSSNPTTYFKKALTLFSDYHVGNIFRTAKIKIGEFYDESFIKLAIINALDKEPVVNCLLPKKSSSQYLLQIQFCFDTDNKLVHCTHGNTLTPLNACVEGDIEYPIIPPDYKAYMDYHL